MRRGLFLRDFVYLLDGHLGRRNLILDPKWSDSRLNRLARMREMGSGRFSGEFA